MKITEGQLRRLIRKTLNEQHAERAPTIRGAHPLIDGLYLGNGTVPELFKGVPEAMEIMRSNIDNQVFNLALSIIDSRTPVPYLPFQFDSQLIGELELAGLAPNLVSDLSYGLSGNDYEYNPPDW